MGIQLGNEVRAYKLECNKTAPEYNLFSYYYFMDSLYLVRAKDLASGLYRRLSTLSYEPPPT